MVASKARKELRRRQLEQTKKDERRKRTEEAVFGEFEDVDTNVEANPEEEKASANNGTDDVTNAEKPSKVKKAKKDNDRKQQSQDDSAKSQKQIRFIVFAGSLPFTATKESIAKHFAKVEPVAIRLSTSKETGKSRGFAFLEFDRFERMNDCLRLYHHSMFDDGQGGEPRRINIELTAGGGGGKSKERKERIRAKNEKLAGERARRAKASKAKEGDGKEGRAPGRASDRPAKFKATGANAVAAGNNEQDNSIHPSRLARMSR